MANGLTAFAVVLIFLLFLPEFLGTKPIYPGPAEVATLIITFMDGLFIYRKGTKSQRPRKAPKEKPTG